MKLFNAFLKVKKSTLPGCGKGLFTQNGIPKGSRIAEYKGKISTWNTADHDDGKNPYIFYISRTYVIDAKGEKRSVAHFANDAQGFKRVKGITNNAVYTLEGKKVFIETIKNIEPGEEVFVGYGKEYWKVMKENGIIKDNL